MRSVPATGSYAVLDGGPPGIQCLASVPHVNPGMTWPTYRARLTAPQPLRIQGFIHYTHNTSCVATIENRYEMPITGKTLYAAGETGEFSIVANVLMIPCGGHAQVDIAAHDPVTGAQIPHLPFIGDVLKSTPGYCGHPLPAPPPTTRNTCELAAFSVIDHIQVRDGHAYGKLGLKPGYDNVTVYFEAYTADIRHTTLNGKLEPSYPQTKVSSQQFVIRAGAPQEVSIPVPMHTVATEVHIVCIPGPTTLTSRETQPKPIIEAELWNNQ